MMMIYENIRLALFSLKANKMRALLTMLGIIIGIGSVIAIMTVGDSVTSTVADSMSSLGANNITVTLEERKDDEEASDAMFVKKIHDHTSRRRIQGTGRLIRQNDRRIICHGTGYGDTLLLSAG